MAQDVVREFTIYDSRITPEPNSGCWLWMGYVNKKGYGWVHRAPFGVIPTHRAFWIRKNGPIPTGLVIDHMCRVRSCCNPDHLRAVTRRVNALENSESLQAKNAAKECCPKCSTAYSVKKNGKRFCRPCVKANHRIYMPKWRAANRMAEA